MITEDNQVKPTRESAELENVAIRFVGDSGDGMQLTGTQFSDTSAMFGNDVATFPNYPAEIRAPQGSLYGVSGFQVQIGSVNITTPGDAMDMLVAMNPAALKTNISTLKAGQILIVDTDEFNSKNFEKAHITSNPLEDGTVDNFKVIKVPMTSLTREALSGMSLDNKSMTRSKNMFALGMVYFIYNRPMDYTIDFFEKKFKNKPEIVEANIKALKAGYYYAETLEIISTTYQIAPAKMKEGTYRIINGNQATAWGLMAAAHNADMRLFLGSYPITPATEILSELTNYPNFNVKTFQAEDEIAGITSSIGAAFAGNMAVTTTSGPGLALKTEAMGLALMMELPLVIVNVQRGGPSTGLPTKTEQSDLLQALYGRHGESPMIVLAASTPENCFNYAFQACKLAVEHNTPVILLTDGYIANGSAPWKIQKTSKLPSITPRVIKTGDYYNPYDRDEKTLARSLAYPGTPNMEHRLGGLEKDKTTGNISYVPENHELMVRVREEKVQRMQDEIPLLKTEFQEDGDLLVIGWGGTYGNLSAAVHQINKEGYKVGHMHLNYINPLPKNVVDIMKKFKKLVVCELNTGQMAKVLTINFPEFQYHQYNKIQGFPFTTKELTDKFKELI
jgi:2-oxoglutarate ferredoxin oxidoreductase subunit alpha